MENRKMKRKIGQFYKIGADIYLLCQTGYNEIALVGLHSGNRWVGVVTVKDPFQIISEEWEQITDGDKFEQIKISIKEK